MKNLRPTALLLTLTLMLAGCAGQTSSVSSETCSEPSKSPSSVSSEDLSSSSSLLSSSEEVSSVPSSSQSVPSETESPKVVGDEDETPFFTNLSVIRINTVGSEKIPTDKTKIPCKVTLQDRDLTTLCSGLTATVRVRGNGSLTVGEKHGKLPYKLNFAEKINLFGIGDGPDKDWVLIPNMGDRTMLRNFAAKRLGELLDGIPVSTRLSFVSLFVNGEYVGVYELCEQVEVGKYRVQVNDGLAEAENGFLVELDHYARDPDEDDVVFGVGDNLYTVKSKVKNDAQLDFIIDYIEQVETAIFAGDREATESLVDVSSLVDMYILQEFSKNTDAGFSSFFMYRNPSGKLTFAPPWDFDLAFGNDCRLDDGSPEGIYVGVGREDFTQNHLWYIALYKTEWFRALVRERWAEVSENIIPQLLAEVAERAAFLAPDMTTNFDKWNKFSTQLHLEPEHLLEFTTYKQHTDHLISWMTERKEFLDREWT